MGIELPAELQDVAARTGAKWPEADEDKMRESASAWRDAAKSIEALTSAADGTAQGALGAFDGEAAQAARRDWDKLVADDGVLPSSAKQCRAAADRLDHAAEQVGAAKVQLVRELVVLAKQTDAAEQAAAAGHPQALAALDSALNGAAANVAQVHNTLTSAVDLDSGVLVEPHGSQGLLSADGGALGAASSTVDAAVTHGAGAVSGAAGAVGETAHGAVDGVGRVANETADGVGRVADETVGGAAEGIGRTAHETVGGVAGGVGRAAHDTVGDVGGAVEGVGRSAHGTVGGVAAGAHGAVEEVARTAGPWQGDAEHTGPVKVDPGGWAPGLADAGTGPIPVIGDSARSGWTPEGGDPASSTAPHAVHSAWASPQAPQPPLPGAAAPPQGFAPPPPAAPGGHFVAQPGAPGAPPVSAAPPPAAAARPSMPPVAPRGPIAFGSPGSQAPQAPQPQTHKPQAPQPQTHQPQTHQPMQRAPLRPLPAPAQPPAPVVPDAPQRPLRQGSRNADVVAFVLHQFPIGYMPVAASKASRQLPVPEAVEEDRPGLSFPPQDHPQSHLVDDSDALERARSAEVYAAAQRDRAERSEPEQLPAELTEGHEPLGELSEPEWERRFLARVGERSEYAWPPAAEFPEGGVEPAEPVVLEPDTVLDCLSSGDGRSLFAAATPFAQRSLPASYDERDYRRYRVMRPLPVWQAVAAPWFAQPGGGKRYRATYSLIDLVGLGYLVELTKAREVAEAATLRIAREDVSDGGAVDSTVDSPREEATSEEDGKTAVASTERITRDDVEVKAAEAGVASKLRIARDEADDGPATTDGGTAQEAAK
ncbi:TNT domain-containing protein [Saccharopolyspora pogona]|uniref:TNT domain-containing protein n=1 Tax=Saccharopolyspora pogona TaxID=333966 RepID=UPI001683B4CF|nr:TNT domain-containing protein [Saccharopolyspora pogona]